MLDETSDGSPAAQPAEQIGRRNVVEAAQVYLAAKSFGGLAQSASPPGDVTVLQEEKCTS